MYPMSPEPRLTPPEPRFVLAECGCEVFEGETMYWAGGRTYCPDCAKELSENDIDFEEEI